MDRKETAAHYPLLESIASPEDLKGLPAETLSALSDEIRAFLLEHVCENGGHLASNLGVVELTLAIHRVFSTPYDHVIFDVGHQSYVHKLLTGRREAFASLRRAGGLCGFPNRAESEHDCFGTGHASTSISAGIGFAEADRLQGSDAYTVCVLGDGAYTGGMIHEALNNCRKKLRLILILNENEMSISKNIGRFATTLSRLRTSEGYFKTKSATGRFLRRIPLIGKGLFAGLLRMKMALKSALYGSNYFEDIGLYYLGPVDGNNEAAVERLLREARESGQSCVVHVKTRKGKGYAPAEATPDLFHGLSPRNVPVPARPCFSQVMGDHLTELARKRREICAITAAMASGTGLLGFRGAHQGRFFDVGIAEEHAVTFAAGLAANGQRPVVAIYSTFLQRAYDNIVHDVALQDLPVVFCIDRAGLNASDGATHHGLFDVAFLSEIPNLEIYTPITDESLCRMMDVALKSSHPAAIRYPNGCEEEGIAEAFYPSGFDPAVLPRPDFTSAEDLEAVIITHGRIVREAMEAKARLASAGTCVGIILLEQIKPYDRIAEQVASILPNKPIKVLFLEEEIRAGGMGMLLSDALSRYEVMQNKTVHILATDDSFVHQTQNEPIRRTAGVDADRIVQLLTE